MGKESCILKSERQNGLKDEIPDKSKIDLFPSARYFG